MIRNDVSNNIERGCITIGRMAPDFTKDLLCCRNLEGNGNIIK